jgi:hypothetical protein
VRSDRQTFFRWLALDLKWGGEWCVVLHIKLYLCLWHCQRSWGLALGTIAAFDGVSEQC